MQTYVKFCCFLNFYVPHPRPNRLLRFYDYVYKANVTLKVRKVLKCFYHGLICFCNIKKLTGVYTLYTTIRKEIHFSQSMHFVKDVTHFSRFSVAFKRNWDSFICLLCHISAVLLWFSDIPNRSIHSTHTSGLHAPPWTQEGKICVSHRKWAGLNF